MNTPSKKPIAIALILIYLVLWFITWGVGIPQVDQTFDRNLSMGSVGFGGEENRIVPVERIDFFDASDLENIPDEVPDTPWRCRSNGIAIAPFIILDDVAWQNGALSGYAGKRCVFWFFGYVKWIPIKEHWIS